MKNLHVLGKRLTNREILYGEPLNYLRTFAIKNLVRIKIYTSNKGVIYHR